MATRREVALLKVLAAAAWADGRMDREESNRLKELILRFSPGPEDLREIEDLLASPVSYARCEELARELLGMLSSRADRDMVMGEIEQILGADGRLTAEEAEIRDSLRGVMDAMSSVDTVLTRMSGVFRKVFGGRKPGAMPGDLSEYLKNAVLRRVDDLSAGAWRESLEADTLNRHTLFGAVLGRVAHADQEVSSAELERIREVLSARCGLRPPLLEWTIQAVVEASTTHLDRQGLLSEFNRLADHEERIRLLDAAFAVAAADGTVGPEELEELRLISNYLWLTPRDFHAVRGQWASSSSSSSSGSR